MVDVVREEHAREPHTLFLIGAYSIGKAHPSHLSMSCRHECAHWSGTCSRTRAFSCDLRKIYLRAMAVVTIFDLDGAGLAGARVSGHCQGARLEDLV